MREIFHPVTGAVEEANVLHVQQQRLLMRAEAARGVFVIWDIGLGAAGNALAAIDALSRSQADVCIHSFDRTTAPLEFALRHAAELPEIAAHEGLLRQFLSQGNVAIGRIQWDFHLGDFCEQVLDASLERPAAIFYDPYSHTVNPEMWTLRHFENVFRRLRPEVPCLLTNYTRSTAVRVTLLLAGFFVGRGAAIGEKIETTIASNVLSLLERPLDARWLESVRRSSNAAPLREGRTTKEPIAAQDFERLCKLPQFRS